MRPRADVELDRGGLRLRTRTRASIAAGGTLLAGGGATLLAIMIHAMRVGESWNEVVGVGALAIVVLIVGCQAIYVGATGRLRGRANRWLAAVWKSLLGTLP